MCKTGARRKLTITTLHGEGVAESEDQPESVKGDGTVEGEGDGVSFSCSAC